MRGPASSSRVAVILTPPAAPFDDDEDACPVCYVPHGAGMVVLCEVCKHAVCAECDRNLTKAGHERCPMCRAPRPKRSTLPARILIHAFHCRDTTCAMPQCAETKLMVLRMQMHAQNCANRKPGGSGGLNECKVLPTPAPVPVPTPNLKPRTRAPALKPPPPPTTLPRCASCGGRCTARGIPTPSLWVGAQQAAVARAPSAPSFPGRCRRRGRRMGAVVLTLAPCRRGCASCRQRRCATPQPTLTLALGLISTLALVLAPVLALPLTRPVAPTFTLALVLALCRSWVPRPLGRTLRSSLV